MSKRPFIIDCDTGTDDAIAILAAYGCPDMDILAITSVNGNVAEKYTSANNLNLVEYLGKETKVAGNRTAVRKCGVCHPWQRNESRERRSTSVVHQR